MHTWLPEARIFFHGFLHTHTFYLLPGQLRETMGIILPTYDEMDAQIWQLLTPNRFLIQYKTSKYHHLTFTNLKLPSLLSTSAEATTKTAQTSQPCNVTWTDIWV